MWPTILDPPNRLINMEALRKTAGVIDLRSSKVPAVTLGFWVIKIAATTLGETAGDAV